MEDTEPANPTVEDDTEDFVNPNEFPMQVNEEEKSWGDRMIKPIGSKDVLPPRYRKIAEYYASGMKPGDIAKTLDYTKARISVILSHSRVQQEVAEIQNQVFTGTMKDRMKRFGDLALDNIERTLRGGGTVTPSIQNETSKWVFEHIEGKPQQSMDIGENLLGVLVDRFDRAERDGKLIDVTPPALPAKPELSRSPEPDSAEERTQRDELDDWFKAN